MQPRFTRMIWPAIAVVAVAILAFERFGVVSSARQSEKEFRAWEKTPLGTYKQVKKNYFLNEALCKNVISVLNQMSTKAPTSDWVLSHTTASTFECLPATVIPRGASENISDFSDDPSVESGGEKARE